MAFQALYAWEQSGSGIDSLLNFDWLSDAQKERLGEDCLVFSRLLVSGVAENLSEIDGVISKNITNWDIGRLQKVDLAILRMGVYSLLYQRDLHPLIVIDEAVEIAREFSSPDSYRFVNAVLDAVRKAAEKPAEVPAGEA